MINDHIREYSALALILLLVCPTTSSSTLLLHPISDESGTLILIARTKQFVVISVDSKITQSAEVSVFSKQRRPINPERKLIDVGLNSACVLDGNLGIEGDRSDISASIRDWLSSHPSVEADEGFEDILRVSAEAWNNRKFQRGQSLPQERRENSFITRVQCAGASRGRTYIVRSETLVNADFTARYRVLSPIGERYVLPFRATGYNLFLSCSLHILVHSDSNA